MGVFDNLQCEVPLPDGRVFQGTFQTKSLDGLMQSFTITADGRLIHHRFRHTAATQFQDMAGNLAIRRDLEPAGEVDVEFHGDIRFNGIDVDGHHADYVARFTNGQLEWIKPYDQLTGNQRHWLNVTD